MSRRAIEATLTLVAIALVAGIVHITSLLIVPRVAPDDAFARLSAVTREASVSALPRGGSARAPLPDQDPSLATAVCRYDLGHGPLRVSAALGDGGFVALTLHSRSGVAFYGLDDRAGDDGKLELVVMTAEQFDRARAADPAEAPPRDVRVVAPQREGFVLFDILPRAGGDPQARSALASAGCRVEHLP